MRVSIHTLGCKVNFYESEVMINLLKENGFEICDFNEICDIYIVNTCSVTDSADSKCRKIINKAINKNKNAIIVVAGCYSQMNSEELKKNSNIDIIIGTKDKNKIVTYINEYIDTLKQKTSVYDLSGIEFEDMNIHSLKYRTRAFVKIQDGCNNYCSYCIIPYARGNARSKNKDKVIEEINCLVKNGYKEVVLTGIHTGSYGRDFKNYTLSDLLMELLNIKDLKRIRISSIEATEIDDKFLEILKNTDIIANHLHIPLQSGCNKILKLMNRKYDVEYFLQKISDIRKIRPDISITTDVIVGFPCEEEEDFLETYNFCEYLEFSKIHVFPYSKRDLTPAKNMDNQVSNIDKKKRVKNLMELSKKLEKDYMDKFVGKTMDVLIEKCNNDEISGHTTNYLYVTAKGNNSDINKIKKVLIKNINYPKILGDVI